MRKRVRNRVMFYGVFFLLSVTLLWDTNWGTPISAQQSSLVLNVAYYLQAQHLPADAKMVMEILHAGGFRESYLLPKYLAISRSSSITPSYYAYTPTLARTRVFLGDDFWKVGKIGRASILLHELEHIRRHRTRLFRGFPRAADEAEAYKRQYATHEIIHLGPATDDSVVYWDMMIGVKDYVVPRYPDYARVPEVQSAMRQLAGMAWAQH